MELIRPDWPAPPQVQAVSTTRLGGVSQAPYDGLNLGEHVGDDPDAVVMNRKWLRSALPAEPLWLKQVHGTDVVRAEAVSPGAEADAAWTTQAQCPCVVMTADCLPVLFCDREGSRVAAAHAGWRGLRAGILEATLFDLGVAPADLLVWLGPAIGPEAYEVGPEVREAFLSESPLAEAAFRPGANDRWLMDIYALARQRLNAFGVTEIYGGDLCTYSDSERFFSYRRDGVTGRMASVIWLAHSGV